MMGRTSWMSKIQQPNTPDAARPNPSDHEGVAFVATLRGTPGRDVLDTALGALENLHHGCSQSSGILTHIPDRLLRAELGADLPPKGSYALGFLFLADPDSEHQLVSQAAADEGFAILSWRDVPVNDTIVAIDPRARMPRMRQVILVSTGDSSDAVVDAALYRLRVGVEGSSGAYFASLSRTTVVYKGLVPATQLGALYADLADPRYCTEIAIVHSGRGGEHNAWSDAQPHRVLAHDGAIHSYASNETWLRARLPLMESPALGHHRFPFVEERTAEGNLDAFVELLHRSGRSLPTALRMVIPEQWGHRMSEAEREFYDYAATVVEPWEGSGVTCFADGYLIGAVLDRHGTRSGRYWVTETGLVVFASETGVVDLDPSTISKKGRLAPGELIAVDTVVGNIFPSAAVRAAIAGKHPYGQWLRDRLITLDPGRVPGSAATKEGRVAPPERGRAVPSRKLTFFNRFLSQRSHLMSPYIDTVTVPAPRKILIGPEHNVLRDGPEHANKVALPGPVVTVPCVTKIAEHLRVHRVSGVYPVDDSHHANESIGQALTTVRGDAEAAVAAGAEVLLLSNLGARSGESVAIPSILLAATVHQHLLDTGGRARASIIVEAGDAQEAVHINRLLAVGAEAVVPNLTAAQLGGETPEEGSPGGELERLRRAVYESILESGVAEYRAFQGSRRFHIIGLGEDVVGDVFTDVPHALGSLSFEQLGAELRGENILLDPVHELLEPMESPGVDISDVESSDALRQRFMTAEPLQVTDTREGVDVFALATARDVLLLPPAHHDTVGPDGLGQLVAEIRDVNSRARVHAPVGADLSSGVTAREAIRSGADVIHLVDGEYKWVFGLIAISQRISPRSATIVVGSPLASAHEVFVAGVLGAREFRLRNDVDSRALIHQLRELLARVGVKSFDHIIGNRSLLDWSKATQQWGRAGVDLTDIPEDVHSDVPRDPPPRGTLDHTFTSLAGEAICGAEPVRINAFVSNTDVSVGACISGEIARRHGRTGLADDSIRVTLTGSSGASLGAYAAPGLTITVEGEAGDFVGKGLSGGKVIMRPEATANFFSHGNVIAGSAIGYGASAGEIYLAGAVGERLGAHNWGATIVCEGAGDAVGYRMHAGTIVILGDTGVNLGAGMDGGVIYALDLSATAVHQNPGTSAELEIRELDELDERVLTAVLAQHVEATRSRIATLLLADPDQLRIRFRRIYRTGHPPEQSSPHDGAENVWRRVLAAAQAPTPRTSPHPRP